MRKLFFGLLVLGSISSFAQDIDVFDCSNKAVEAAYSIAQIELGDDCVISEKPRFLEGEFTTEVKIEVKIQQAVDSYEEAKKAIKRSYEVTTVDLDKNNLCIISSVALKY